MQSIRKDMLALCITLIALISQMFFGIVHATSIWTAAAGPIAQVEVGSVAHSFLQICSAGGLVTLEGETESSGTFDPSLCSVCSSAVASPTLEGEEPVLPTTQQVFTTVSFKSGDQIGTPRLAQANFARGPPLFS
ncbi:hypothetical protein [Cohaesibacter intestini]|uniref:hypothetical protein n=1 Tax=Cohaesibacter intestini TaxID=2211145 RepID=UPI000DEA947A|nr:hypothetical protein [Cohaesibacter intestini]